MAKWMWTKRIHVGGRRYQLNLKIGHQSFTVGDVGTAREIGWLQSQLAIALVRIANAECIHFPDGEAVSVCPYIPNAPHDRSR
jgi:hypothetical protein